MRSKFAIRMILLKSAIAGFTLFLLAFPTKKTEATFPGKSIAHWKLSQSNEITDPDFIKVHQLVQKNVFASALEILEVKSRVIKTQPTTIILKAIILNDMDQPIRALKLIKKAFLLESHHPAVQFGFCQIHRNLGQADLSRRACVIATQQHPNAPETHYELAQTLMALGEMNEAAEELRRAIELAPQTARYYYENGLIFTYFNNNAKAESYFLKAIDLNPQDLDSAYQLAYLFAISGKINRAKKYIDRILSVKEAHPKQSSARILADYIRKQSIDKLPVAVNPANFHKSRSKAYYKSKKYGLSLLEIQTANRAEPNNKKILEILTGLSSLLLRLDIAEPIAKQFAEQTEKNKTSQARAYQKLGDIKVLQGSLNEAKNYYQKAITLGDPSSLAKTALEELPDSVQISTPHLNQNEIYVIPANGLNRTGEVFAHYGMFKRALGVYSMVLKLNPKHLMAMLNIGTVYYRTTAYDRAIVTLEKILAIYPQHEYIAAHRLLLAQAYIQKKDWGAGIKNLKILFKINPEYKKIVRTDPVFKPLYEKSAYKKILQ